MESASGVCTGGHGGRGCDFCCGNLWESAKGTDEDVIGERGVTEQLFDKQNSRVHLLLRDRARAKPVNSPTLFLRRFLLP